MKKVLAFGVFDKLHPGHKYFLRQAKKHGGCLIVVIARDSNVAKIKGKKPKQSEEARLKNIKKLKSIDKAILGYKNYKNRSKIIKKINPNIICLGYDQADLKLRSKKIKIIRLKPHHPHKYKSSLL